MEMDLRSSLLGSAPRDSKIINITIGGKEMKVEIKRASLEDRDKISENGTLIDEKGRIKYKPKIALLWGIILQTFVPFPEESNGDDPKDDMFKNAGNRVFEDADFEILYKLPETTPFIDRISDITDAFLIVDRNAIKKNYNEIQNDN